MYIYAFKNEIYVWCPQFPKFLDPSLHFSDIFVKHSASQIERKTYLDISINKTHLDTLT